MAAVDICVDLGACVVYAFGLLSVSLLLHEVLWLPSLSEESCAGYSFCDVCTCDAISNTFSSLSTSLSFFVKSPVCFCFDGGIVLFVPLGMVSECCCIAVNTYVFGQL